MLSLFYNTLHHCINNSDTIHEEKNEESDSSGEGESSSDDEGEAGVFGNKIALRQ